MSSCAAKRRLLASKRGESFRREIVVKVGLPYVVKQDEVDFPVDGEVSACELSIEGLDESFSLVTFGADQLQALQLSIDIDPVLKRMSEKYDFFFPTGHAYFE